MDKNQTSQVVEVTQRKIVTLWLGNLIQNLTQLTQLFKSLTARPVCGRAVRTRRRAARERRRSAEYTSTYTYARTRLFAVTVFRAYITLL